MSEDNESNGNENVHVFNDSVAVQILSRLDEYAYEKAIDEDARTINEKYLLPLSFPWRQGARLPKKALKAMPRDIDELHAITHCDGTLHAPFGDFNGPFGFGRYENGQSRGNYGTRQLEESVPQSLGSNAIAAARRTDDPGVIELAVQLPLPPSIDSIKLTPAQWEERLIWNDAENAETLSRLPYNWDRKKNTSRLNENPDKQYTTLSESSANAAILTECAASPRVALEQSNEKLSESKSKANKQREFSMACIRKWKISTRVDRVSTRSSLFPSSTVVDYDSADKSKRKVVRPMLCCGIFAQEVQSGQSVSVEKALELDEEGLSYRLGSYDCRFLDKLITTKKEPVIRSKRVEVGRTRLVWTSVIQGDEPFTPSTRNRIAYNSLLTGRRVDPTRVSRPREVKVGVRVEGKLILEEAIEDVEVSTSSSKKRKHSTRQAAESEVVEKKTFIECPATRTEEQIDDAFVLSLATTETLLERRLLAKTTENGAVVYLDMNSKSSAPAQIDRRTIIASLLKFKRHKKVMRRAVQDFSHRSLKSYAPPRFAMLPLEDGILRSVCMSSGKMLGSAVHELIRDASRNDAVMRCSVCWSDEGAGQEGVQECSTCGLLAHLGCCLDKGQFIALSNDEIKPCSVMKIDRSEVEESHGIDGMTNPIRPSSSLQQWQCAVCCQYSEKPRRNARLPSRFKDDDVVRELAKESVHSDSTSSTSKNIPGPRCTLCPHRGGAMSLLEPKDSHQWAHEVCRIWSNADVPESEEIGSRSFHRYPKFLSSACALCGGGGVKRGKSENVHYVGLVQCAARGCYVAFHPMCALIASKTNMEEMISVPSRRTRVSTEQTTEEKKCEEDDDRVVEDRKLCNEYTLQLVKLVRTEGAWPRGNNTKTKKTTIIPVAFCGLHNPGRDSAFYGCLPGGGVMEE
eukprot:CCRYP_017798-RA/>CCRYP_017798-RA protein AED:0.33 eAED:0.33 QI:135/1/1/1/0/0/2/232/913